MAQSTELFILLFTVYVVAIISPGQSQVSIGFERAKYSFAEDSGLHVVYLTKRHGSRGSWQTFSIHLEVEKLPESAQLGRDFSISGSDGSVSTFVMAPHEQRIPVIIHIRGDTIPEYNESFWLRCSMARGSTPFQCNTNDGCFQSTEIEIVDNDQLVIGFENTSLVVSESAGKVEFCVSIIQPSNAPVEIKFNLTVQTHAGTADSSDYTEVTTGNQTLEEFNNYRRRQCFDVTILNDTTPEDTETFNISLVKHNLPKVRVHPGTVTIQIVDDDLVLGFERATYITSEGNGSVEVCVQVKSGVPLSPLHLSLTTVDGDATDSADYASTTVDLRFGPSSRKRCVQIPVINDMIPEVPEQFSVILAMTTPLPGIVLTPDVATVAIHDDDVILGFEHRTYTTSEASGSVEVCVEVMSGAVQSPLILSLTTADGNATGSADYISIATDLRFELSSREQCVQIPIINDIVPEVQECFRIMLTVTTPLPGIILTPDNATVVINNDDELVVGFENVSLEVSESAGKVEICVSINQPSNVSIEMEFNLTVETLAGTADSSDFVELTSANQFLNEFGNHNRRQCFNVTIINDNTDENGETFTVVLAKPSNERNPHIRIHPGTITIMITDDDNALPSCDSFLRILFPSYFHHCDATCTYAEWSQWQRVPNSDVNVAEATCNSGQAYSERRSQSAPENGCDPKTETRQVCILDREDTLIYSLGLGSTGYDYSVITEPIPQGTGSPPTPPSNTTRRRRQSPALQHRCPDRGTDGYICHSLVKRSLGKEWLPPYRYHKRHLRQTNSVNQICQRRSILFVLDTSGSIGRESYRTMTTAVSSLVTLFCVPTQFAVITFAHKLRLEFCFNCFDNTLNGRRAAGQAIINTRYRHGPWTRTGAAARCVCNELLDRYKCGLWTDSCIDVVFITDGHSNGALDVCREVQCLHNHRSRHINTYAIGINNYNAEEIRCLSRYSNSEQVVFGFESFNEFYGYLNNVTARLLSTTNTARYNCINRDRSLNP